MVLDDQRLSRSARGRITKADRIAYSMVSFWEIALKISRKDFDLDLPQSWDQELLAELRTLGALRVDIEPVHCRHLQNLPWHHKDPFDRMLIAQAAIEHLTVLTADVRFRDYGIRVVW